MIINKQDISGILDNLLAKEYQVYAPVKYKETYSVLERITAGSEADFDYTNVKKPPKEILFPQTEDMFKYDVTEEGVQVEEFVDRSLKVIFGIRPCDAKSFTMLDKVFNNDLYQDVYYNERRKNTVLVGIGCAEPEATCFCTSCGTAPMSEEGSDIFLVDIGDKYLVKVVTEKGQKLVSAFGKLEKAAENDYEEAKKAASEAAEKVKSNINLEGLKEKLDGMFDSPVWGTIQEKCLGCAACTYLCPTCHCFDINDDAVDAQGKRVRDWDSCMFPLFTLHGSGHNPRPSGKERMRQRIMHKFRYFVENFGLSACVGCGRCIKNCPVNLDIREVISLIQEQDNEARSVK